MVIQNIKVRATINNNSNSSNDNDSKRNDGDKKKKNKLGQNDRDTKRWLIQGNIHHMSSTL